MNCSNSVLHYLYIMADDLVIYAKARAFKARIYPPPCRAEAPYDSELQ